MLNSALHIKDLVARFKKEKINIKVIVGGAPFIFDRELWKEVGAYAMGANASDALVLVHDAGMDNV
jgi:methanogenic corrinoid protein MtbC1